MPLTTARGAQARSHGPLTCVSWPPRYGRLNATSGEYGSDHVEEGGVGLKYGLSSNLTFDFTYNPDFSNIESETQQIEINQRFPLREAAEAHRALEGRRTTGSTLLLP